MSRRHAHIQREKSSDRYVITDLGSPNGTYLNGLRIPADHPRALGDWDKIRIASAVFTVRVVSSPLIIRSEFHELRSRVETQPTEVVRLDDLSSVSGQAALSGQLEHLCPVELFQMLEVGVKSGMLTIATDGHEGAFTISAGQVVAARLGEKRGEEAVYDVLMRNRGTFAFSPQAIEVGEPEITMGTTNLLMEGCRLFDEAAGQAASQ